MWSQQPPSKKPKLSIGRTVQDWRSMHLLEGSIRTEARRDGHFLDTWSRSKEYLSSSKHEFSYFFACVSGQKCSFYLRFGPHNQEKEEGWICEQLCLTHTCSSIAPAISEELLKRLAFWVSTTCAFQSLKRSSNTILYAPAQAEDQRYLHCANKSTNIWERNRGALSFRSKSLHTVT